MKTENNNNQEAIQKLQKEIEDLKLTASLESQLEIIEEKKKIINLIIESSCAKGLKINIQPVNNINSVTPEISFNLGIRPGHIVPKDTLLWELILFNLKEVLEEIDTEITPNTVYTLYSRKNRLENSIAVLKGAGETFQVVLEKKVAQMEKELATLKENPETLK